MLLEIKCIKCLYLQKKIFFSYLIFFFLINQNIFAETIYGKPKIIDGDTIKINLKKIRLHGIDAPEKNQICKKNYFSLLFIKYMKNYKCGIFSKENLAKKIENNFIKCETEKKKDKYNRYLGTCFLNKINLNSWMVKNGYAIAYRKYSKKYILDEEYARKEKLGIWNGKFTYPAKWRKEN